VVIQVVVWGITFSGGEGVVIGPKVHDVEKETKTKLLLFLRLFAGLICQDTIFVFLVFLFS
jgi:hypothetical protein